MAEENKVEESADQVEQTNEDGQEQAPAKKSNVLVLAVIGLFVLLVSIGGYLLLSSTKEEEPKQEIVVVQPSVFYEMPEIIVSLSGHSSNIRYLKLVLSFELASAEDQAVVESLMPKITDEFQVYLRQLRLEDLRGNVGSYRLKEALLLRINQVVQPVEAKDVLIKEMLIQ